MKKVLALVLAVLTAISLFALAGCGEKDANTIVVGASSTPHAEILEIAKENLAKQGWTLEIKVFDDYVLPNTNTEDGELDANYFQHTPYLTDFNEKNGTHLVSVAAIHYEPLGLYAGTTKALADLPAGAKIAVPNDGSNEARALYLLEAQGLIKLAADAGMTATVKDIVENKNNYQIEEVEAALIPGMLDDVAVAVINGNYAIGAGLDASKALAIEDKNSTAAQTYANILVVKEGNENNAGIKALIEALQSEEVKTFINNTYGGAVVPIF